MAWQFARKVVTEKGQTRYIIEPLVIAAVIADETAYPAHFDYYKALAQQHDKRQDYVGLAPEADNLEAAFEWAMSSEDGVNALNLANTCGHFLSNRGRFQQRINWFERVAEKLSTHPNESLRANAQNSLGIIYNEHPVGDQLNNLKQAVAAYEAALVYWTPEVAPMEYAITQNNLGTAYGGLAQIEDRAGNLKRAVAAYKAALVYRTAEVAPMDYAATQNNLGIAYRALSKIEDQTENLKRAVAAYKKALVYRTAEAAPLAYAMTQNNLAVAYRNMSEIEDQTENLKRAVAAYKAALVYRTAEAAPLAYAQTQYNMAMLFESLAEVENRDENLRKAIATYQAILRIWTFESAPLDYADSQWGLATDYDALGETATAIRCWQEAERAFRKMGVEGKADLMLRKIAEAEKKLEPPA